MHLGLVMREFAPYMLLTQQTCEETGRGQGWRRVSAQRQHRGETEAFPEKRPTLTCWGFKTRRVFRGGSPTPPHKCPDVTTAWSSCACVSGQARPRQPSGYPASPSVSRRVHFLLRCVPQRLPVQRAEARGHLSLRQFSRGADGRRPQVRWSLACSVFLPHLLPMLPSVVGLQAQELTKQCSTLCSFPGVCAC